MLLPPEKKDKKKSASMTRGDAQELVRAAISKGVPVFNDGNHEACAAVYQMTARALMKMPESAVSHQQRRMLQTAMTKVGKSHCTTTNAWTLRHALDQMMVASH